MQSEKNNLPYILFFFIDFIPWLPFMEVIDNATM